MLLAIQSLLAHRVNLGDLARSPVYFILPCPLLGQISSWISRILPLSDLPLSPPTLHSKPPFHRDYALNLITSSEAFCPMYPVASLVLYYTSTLTPTLRPLA